MTPIQNPLGFKCVVITGGGCGIGRVMAWYLTSKGKKVLLAGRAAATLRATAQETGAAGFYVVDTGRTAEIPVFAARITKEHPDLDCLINSADVQPPPESVRDDNSPRGSDNETDSDIRGPMLLTMSLLAHLQTKPFALVVNVASALGFVPFSVGSPVYNGTKAWLHFWSMGLRAQLRKAGSSVRVVEIAPPVAAAGRRRRERSDPTGIKAGKERSPNTLSVDDFVREICVKLKAGEEVVAAGLGNDIVDRRYDARGHRYPLD